MIQQLIKAAFAELFRGDAMKDMVAGMLVGGVGPLARGSVAADGGNGKGGCVNRWQAGRAGGRATTASPTTAPTKDPDTGWTLVTRGGRPAGKGKGKPDVSSSGKGKGKATTSKGPPPEQPTHEDVWTSQGRFVSLFNDKGKGKGKSKGKGKQDAAAKGGGKLGEAKAKKGEQRAAPTAAKVSDIAPGNFREHPYVTLAGFKARLELGNGDPCWVGVRSSMDARGAGDLAALHELKCIGFIYQVIDEDDTIFGERVKLLTKANGVGCFTRLAMGLDFRSPSGSMGTEPRRLQRKPGSQRCVLWCPGLPWMLEPGQIASEIPKPSWAQVHGQCLHSAYNWEEKIVEHKNGHRDVFYQGYARVLKDKADGALEKSGNKDLFLEPLAADADKKPVRWEEMNDQEAAERYFARVAEMAAKERRPLAWRKGGGSCLGLRFNFPSELPAVSASYSCQGVPRSWRKDDLESFLTSAGWSNVQILLEPRRLARPTTGCNSSRATMTFWWLFLVVQEEEHLLRKSRRDGNRRPLRGLRLQAVLVVDLDLGLSRRVHPMTMTTMTTTWSWMARRTKRMRRTMVRRGRGRDHNGGL